MVTASVRRQWPLLVLLVAPAAVDVEASWRLGTAGHWWLVAGAVTIVCLALLTPARPVAAPLAAAATLVIWSVLMRAVGAESLSGLTLTELVALAAMVVTVARQLPGLLAAGLIALLVAGGTAATRLRPDFWPLVPGSVPDPWWTVSMSGVVMAMLPAAYGFYLRGRDRERARAGLAAALAAQERERLTMARELRDVVSPQVSEMVERVRSARTASAADAGAAAGVLPTIERMGVDALSAMRRLVTTLRGPGPS